MSEKIIPEDPKFLKQRMELAETLKQAILEALKIRGTYHYQQICYTFIRFIVPRTGGDVTVLPVVSVDGVSKKRNRVHCLVAYISSLVLLYWEFYDGNLASGARLESGIKTLNSFSVADFENLVVKGDVETGYHVEVK